MAFVLPTHNTCRQCGRFQLCHEDPVHKTLQLVCSCQYRELVTDSLIWCKRYQHEAPRSIYRHQNAAHDVTLPPASQPCARCASPRVVYFHEPTRFVYHCQDCSHVFVTGTK